MMDDVVEWMFQAMTACFFALLASVCLVLIAMCITGIVYLVQYSCGATP